MASIAWVAILATALTPADVRNSLENKGYLIAEGYQDLVKWTGGQGSCDPRPTLDTDNRKGLPMSAYDPTEPYEFRSIPGFPAYRVGPDGCVQSCLEQATGRMTDIWHDMSRKGRSGSYANITLSRQGKHFTKKIAHLVLECFVGPRPFPRAVCRHLDGNPLNNWAWNLAWGTYKENKADELLHSTRQRGSSHYKAILTDDNVVEVRRLLAEGLTCLAIAQRFGVSRPTIATIKSGRSWKHLAV